MSRNASAAEARPKIIHQHESKTCDHSYAGGPPERDGPPAFGHVSRLPGRHDLADQKAGRESADVREVVHAGHDNPQYGDINQPVNQLAAKHLRAHVAAAARDGQQDADHAEQRSGRAHAEMSSGGAGEIPASPGNDEDKEKPRRAVALGWTTGAAVIASFAFMLMNYFRPGFGG